MLVQKRHIHERFPWNHCTECEEAEDPFCMYLNQFKGWGAFILQVPFLRCRAIVLLCNFVTYWMRVTEQWRNAWNGAPPLTWNCLGLIDKSNEEQEKRGQRSLTSCHLQCSTVIKLHPSDSQAFSAPFHWSVSQEIPGPVVYYCLDHNCKAVFHI